MREPQLSIVICCFNMTRELPRTLRSLSPEMQRGIAANDYEVIVVDNGSPIRVDDDAVRRVCSNARAIRIDAGTHSPAHAMNVGIASARGPVVGAMIDGARMVTPGIVKSALLGAATSDRALVLTLAFHLGRKVQMESVAEGYDQAVEDALLAASGWTNDGYRLFEIGVFAESSRRGWFQPMTECNALFMPGRLWAELGGFDERFQSPGGGLVNHDLLARALALPRVQPVTLLGEGTFHQVHGGVATNSPRRAALPFFTEYRLLRGREFKPTPYVSLYVGSLGPLARKPRTAGLRDGLAAARSAWATRLSNVFAAFFRRREP